MSNPFSDILNEKAINDLASKARARAEAIHDLFVNDRATAANLAFQAKEAASLAKRKEAEFISALKRAEAEARAEARAEADREVESEARAEARKAGQPEPNPNAAKVSA